MLHSGWQVTFDDLHLNVFFINSPDQGGKRLGDETSVSEQKGVMQWTGIELSARPKFKIQRSKFKILIIY